jgi:hypothetical protein
MRQHYIPQYYLDGFTGSNRTGKIWVYEKNSSKFFQTTTKAVASENNRWPKQIEEYLANKIENPTNLVLEKIQNHKPITMKDKDILSRYMVVMMKRVPNGLERMKSYSPEVTKKIYDDLTKRITELINIHPSKAELLKGRLLELEAFRDTYENEFPMEIYYSNLSPESTPQICAILPTMTWVFLTAGHNQMFLSNDNPVFYFSWLGIGRPESELVFPICDSIALLATWHHNWKEGYVQASDTIVREINRRTASNVTKYAFYSREASWVNTLINRKNHNFKRIE